MGDLVTVQKVIRKKKQSIVQYEVQLDHGEKIFVTEDVLVKFSLLEGSTLSQTDLDNIYKANSYQDAYNQTLRWLSRAPQAEQTIRRRLVQKGYTDQVIAETINHCKKNGYINDEEYARRLASNRISRGKGKYWIEQELRHLGISDSYIASALNHLSVDDEQKHALALAQKKWKQLSGKPLQERQHKTAQTLARRGYSSELIWKIIPIVSEQLDNNEL